MSSRKKISYFSANVTAIISVAMVLLLLGIVAVIGVAAQEISMKIKEEIGFDISLKEDASEAQISALRREIAFAPYVSRMRYVSKEEALQYWKQQTGEDLVAVLGFNPLTSEIEVHVKSDYANAASLDRLAASLKRNAAVESVTTHTDHVEAVNESLGEAALVLGVVAAAMLVISLALINNTVRMTVYSKRFLIHTMKLVGATPGVIRRPIVVSSLLNGVIAALVAVALLAAMIYYVGSDGFVGESVHEFLPIESMGAICAAMPALGALLCGVTAFFAAGKYIRLDYDKLF